MKDLSRFCTSTGVGDFGVCDDVDGFSAACSDLRKECGNVRRTEVLLSSEAIMAPFECRSASGSTP